VSDTLTALVIEHGAQEEIDMNAFARAAAVAGSLASAAAVVVAVILPGPHATPASAAASGISTGSAAASRGSDGPGAGQDDAGRRGAGQGGGAQAGAGTGTGGANSGANGGQASGGSGSGGSGSSGTGSGSSGSAGTGGSGTGGSGSGGFGSGGIEPIIGTFPHTFIPIVTAVPSPTGTIGEPGVPCLQGYVWRQAFGGDYVCVAPATRSQAAADNAVAVSRVQPAGGSYGQYTCVQGYVWRQVVPGDYTCVTPAIRAQAADDNSQAAGRVALLSLWVTDWTPPSSPAQTCPGDVCSTTEGGWDGPDFQINGDAFNFGPVVLQIRAADGSVLWSTTVPATSYTGFRGAALYARTPVGDCSSVPGTTDNDYVIALDTVSGRWSAKLPIDSDCASF
jgi:hypothetical protein